MYYANDKKVKLPGLSNIIQEEKKQQAKKVTSVVDIKQESKFNDNDKWLRDISSHLSNVYSKYVFSRIWQTEWEYAQAKQTLNIEPS